MLQIDGNRLWMSSKDYVIIVLGIMLYAFGFSAFVLPEKIVIGGLVGIGSLVYFITGIPVAFTSYALNLVLLMFAYKFIGKEFVIRTIFGATVINLMIGIMQPLFPQPLIEQQTFMNLIIGAMMCGVGIGIVFTHNGSTGGTDIVAAMVSRHSNITVGRSMIYCDFLIVSSSYLIFHQIDKIVYGLIVTFLASFMADLVINTNRRAVQFTIISRQWVKIADAINNVAHRGCTVIDGMGWYSKQEVKVLLVMCRKIESVTIFRIVKSIDKDAFITQANVNGVYGEGFDMMKTKIKSVDNNETGLSTHHTAEPVKDKAGETVASNVKKD
ncbi:MAG: YitT family protein [Muribaculum sp.]|nr:YitT family protein [Muribaculum sp.]